MKILIIVDTFPSREHPYILHLFSKLIRLHKKNLDIYSFNEGDIQFAYNEVGGITTEQINKRKIIKSRIVKNPFKFGCILLNIIANSKRAKQLYNYSRKIGLAKKKALGQVFFHYKLLNKNYDVVYINALQSLKHIPVRGLFPNSYLIASSRGQDFDYEPGVYKRLLEKVDHLHVLGQYLKEKALKEGYDDSKPISIIPPALLPINKVCQKKLDDSLKLITAARLTWPKGYIFALRAVAVLYHKFNIDFKYIICGDGPEEESLRYEAKRLKIEKNVDFKGWCTPEEINQIMADSDIYLLLSISEGFNNSVLQAQQFGLPCVVSDAGGLPENILNNITGFVVERYNSLQAAEALLKLVNSKELRKTLGQNAIERVSQTFSLENQVKKYYEMLTLNELPGK